MSAQKSRLLVVTRNLPPLIGGMERLNSQLLAQLSVDFDVRVCCPRECIDSLPATMEASGAPLRPLPRFLASSAWNSIVLARRFRPHLVLAGSGLTAPLAMIAARVAGAKSGAYLHGLDIAADHQLYQQLWVKRFAALDMVVVNSRSTACLAESAGISKGRINIVHPGTELPAWQPGIGQEFRSRFELGDRPLLLSVGRLTARKGIAEFVERIMPGLVAIEPRIYLAVIGGDAADALKGGGAGQRQRLSSLIHRLGLEDNVGLLGELDDSTLHAAFFASRALVFPVLDLPGDTEGFGMVAVEAAAHGVPTVAFAVGGVLDSVSDPLSGSLLPSGDYRAMAERLCSIYRGEEEAEDIKLKRRAFASGFEWRHFGVSIRALCFKVIGAAD